MRGDIGGELLAIERPAIGLALVHLRAVAPLEHRNKPPIAADVRDVLNLRRQPREIPCGGRISDAHALAAGGSTAM